MTKIIYTIEFTSAVTGEFVKVRNDSRNKNGQLTKNFNRAWKTVSLDRALEKAQALHGELPNATIRVMASNQPETWYHINPAKAA